ncbi:MAG: 5-oxoprolinase subunit PxpB [Bacteroidales bacterium]|nr:5-oxoprolinase subunit PxpB [Bacteroidales bacterium]
MTSLSEKMKVMSPADIKIYNSGESAIFCSLGEEISPGVYSRVNDFEKFIKQLDLQGIIETVPSYSGLMIYYNPGLLERETLVNAVNRFQLSGNMEPDEKQMPGVVVPVCYGGMYGPDLQHVAEQCSLEPDEVISIHSSVSYLIYMLGFTPGFPYLGGMDSRISTPRKDDPALSVPAGSVGIAGDQTGIYPVASPGGWQIIGRTPVTLFNPSLESPFLFEPGMRVTFRSVSADEFRVITEQVANGSYITETENRNGEGE